MTTCAHLDSSSLTPVPDDFAYECADCVPVGGRWVHLRRCLTCDHVACCDSSPARHATAHSHTSGHAVITSAEPGELWRWCYVDEVGA
jgi:hypothetical protein